MFSWENNLNFRQKPARKKSLVPCYGSGERIQDVAVFADIDSDDSETPVPRYAKSRLSQFERYQTKQLAARVRASSQTMAKTSFHSKGFNVRRPEVLTNRVMEWKPRRTRVQAVRSFAKENSHSDEFSGLRDKAFEKWATIAAEAGPEHSTVARKMAEAPGEDAARNVLINACQKRADKTLHDRANSIFMYTRYMKSVDTPAFPLTVDKVYDFIESCRIEGAAASRASSVKKALKAATRILGLHNDIRAFDIETIDGSVARQMKNKRRTKRATPLTPGAVMALERATVHSEHAPDRVIAGFLRFTFGTRARGKDAACIRENPTLDINQSSGRGYIDATADVTQTNQRNPQTMRMGVEIAAQSWGL